MLDGVELLKGSKVFHENDQKAIKEWFSYVNWLQTSCSIWKQLAKTIMVLHLMFN
jgi:hypothetical protein